MSTASDVTAHYTSGTLQARLESLLREDGADPARPTPEALAPFEHFHGRGLEATEEMADLLTVSAADRILDVGSGLGGPARYMARRFGCRVDGIDLTSEFCAVGRHLTSLMGLEKRVFLREGDALAPPFPEATFDGAYSMNVAMNIADKPALYGAVRRVLKPSAWFLLSEVALGEGGGPDYPTPWARTAATSFLTTAEETRRGLEEAGFAISLERDTYEASRAYAARARAMVERGEKPPQRAVTLIHGDLAKEAGTNIATAVRDRRVVPMEFLCRKTG